MTSFGYRLNPRYAIKEYSSYGALYTQNCSCSKGNIEDKILVPKPPKNCARCAKCGYLVDGPNCRGCTLLRQELEKNLVTHSPDFQDTSEPSNASTNVVNAPREPYVVKQDNGSFVDKISFDLNRAPDSPNQFHCFHCKDVLKDGEACKRYTCAKCGSGLRKGHCYTCGHNQNSLNDSLSISETSSQSPPNIDHCCYECGAHIGYNCPPKVLIIPNPEPCNNQTIDELPQALSIFHLTSHFEAESPFTLDSTPTYVDESPNVFNPPPQPPVYPCEFCRNDARYGHYCTPQAQFNNPEQGYSQEFNFPQNIHNFQQQYLCCDQCGGPHETFQYEVIKSSVEDLVPIPSESEGENGCDVPSCFTTFSNILFDDEYEFDSVEDQSLHNENFLEKIFSNPLFEEGIKIDLFLTPDDPIPPSIEDDEDSEGDILFERLLHDDPIPLPDTLDFSNIVRVFLPFFTYPVTSSILHPFGNEDTIFDPGITVNHFYSFKPGLSHRCRTFKKFNTHCSHLNESPMEMLFSTCSPMDQ
nr:hypothetical protein [Tanacetum cinerariifolium]